MSPTLTGATATGIGCGPGGLAFGLENARTSSHTHRSATTTMTLERIQCFFILEPNDEWWAEFSATTLVLVSRVSMINGTRRPTRHFAYLNNPRDAMKLVPPVSSRNRRRRTGCGCGPVRMRRMVAPAIPAPTRTYAIAAAPAAIVIAVRL